MFHITDARCKHEDVYGSVQLLETETKVKYCTFESLQIQIVNLKKKLRFYFILFYFIFYF